jgi:hypothetical protein
MASLCAADGFEVADEPGIMNDARSLERSRPTSEFCRMAHPNAVISQALWLAEVSAES